MVGIEWVRECAEAQAEAGEFSGPLPVSLGGFALVVELPLVLVDLCSWGEHICLSVSTLAKPTIVPQEDLRTSLASSRQGVEA